MFTSTTLHSITLLFLLFWVNSNMEGGNGVYWQLVCLRLGYDSTFEEESSEGDVQVSAGLVSVLHTLRPPVPPEHHRVPAPLLDLLQEDNLIGTSLHNTLYNRTSSSVDFLPRTWFL